MDTMKTNVGAARRVAPCYGLDDAEDGLEYI